MRVRFSLPAPDSSSKTSEETMLIIDVDNAATQTIELIKKLIDKKCPGLWGFKVRNLIKQKGAEAVLSQFAGYNVCVDDKIHDTADSVASVVTLYAQLPHPPAWLTISDRVTLSGLQKAVAARRGMQLILTTVLSDATDEDCFEESGQLPFIAFYHRERKARNAGMQGITCPGYLLQHLRYSNWHVLGTGVRSEGVPQHNHYKPITFDDMFGAEKPPTHAVVGREVIYHFDPERALLDLLATCERAKAQRVPA